MSTTSTTTPYVVGLDHLVQKLCGEVFTWNGGLYTEDAIRNSSDQVIDYVGNWQWPGPVSDLERVNISFIFLPVHDTKHLTDDTRLVLERAYSMRPEERGVLSTKTAWMRLASTWMSVVANGWRVPGYVVSLAPFENLATTKFVHGLLQIVSEATTSSSGPNNLVVDVVAYPTSRDPEVKELKSILVPEFQKVVTF
jgi:hypothetical protein